MSQATLINIVAFIFLAGGFYVWARMSIGYIRKEAEETTTRLVKDAKDIHDRLNQKIDKNFETLDAKIAENKRDAVRDLANIGNKVQVGLTAIENKASAAEHVALLRHHNTVLAVTYIAPEDKEKDVISLLREFN